MLSIWALCYLCSGHCLQQLTAAWIFGSSRKSLMPCMCLNQNSTNCLPVQIHVYRLDFICIFICFFNSTIFYHIKYKLLHHKTGSFFNEIITFTAFEEAAAGKLFYKAACFVWSMPNKFLLNWSLIIIIMLNNLSVL